MRFSIIELGWLDGGPFLDIGAVYHTEELSSSLLCINFNFFSLYLEILGKVLVDTFPE